MIGIYKITSPSGRVYIGQSWDIERRFKEYKKSLAIRQTKLFNSIAKYGIENHVFEIIHEFLEEIDQKILDDHEILYWNQYKNLGIDVLNVREPGKGGKHSKETKKLMSEWHKGKVVLESTKEKLRNLPKNNKKIIMLNLNGEFVKEFKNIKEAAKELKSITTPICKVLNNTQKTCKNHFFMYKSDYTNQKLERIARYNTKKILQYDLEGNFIKEFISLTEAEKEINIKGSNSNISSCCKGKRNNAYGFKWEYKINNLK